MKRYGRSRVLVFVLTFIGVALAAVIDGAISPPITAVKSTIDDAIAILHNTQMPVQQRRRELRQLAERNLDLAQMARASLGTHWFELTAAQREEFVPLFAAFIEAAYLDEIQDYARLKIEVSGETFTDPNHARVGATVLQPGEEPIHIQFMLEHKERGWMVYDVIVDDISMVANYSAQLDRVIRSQGITQLVERLKLKQTQLAALLGQPNPAKVEH